MTHFKNSNISRRRMLKMTGATASAAALGGTLSGLAGPAYAQGANSIAVAIAFDPPSLDPLAIEQSVPAQVTWNIYEPLFWRDPNGYIIPWLAESIESTSPTTVVLKLRDGVKFQNGEAFNAEAAAFSINRILDPETKSQWIGTVNTIKSAKAVGELAVQVTTHEPDPVLQGRLTVIAMMAPGWTSEIGDQVGVKTNGTGPYQLEDWKRNLSIDLSRNPNYWGPTPDVESLTFRVIPEDATRFQSLNTGEIDLYLGVLPDQVDQAPKYVAGVAQNYSFLRLSNLETSNIADPRIRQAMNYAIDKDGLRNALHGGLGNNLNGQLSVPEMTGFNPNLDPYPYDLQRAQDLIREAGAQNLEVTIEGPKGRYTGDSVEMQAIGAMLEQAGIHVNLVLRDPNNWVRIGDRNQTPAPPDAWYVRHTNTTFDADRTLSSYYSLRGSYSSYSNAEVDKNLDASRKEMDPAKRLALLNRCYEIGSREDPMGVYLFQHTELWGMRKEVDFTAYADGVLHVSQIKLNG
ncbi:MAG: ABC transporter substrate-binding protein [Paracoccaceae bacterium]|nr:ABC transporter substrate-binding protein [Paracoccaceae bacterium]